jgi:AraC-like DNA-binding protein
MLPPSDELVARLIRRYAPDNYYIGANARCFRTVRQVTLFGRRPLIMPTADFHGRYVLLLGIGAGAVVISGERRHVVGPGQALLVPPFTLHRYEALDGARHPLGFIGFEADMGDDAPDGVALHALATGTTSLCADAWQVVDRIDTAFDAAPALVPALTLQLLETLLGAARGDPPAPVSHPEWERTQHVARLARTHPTWGVPELARACGASESVLRGAVSSTTGMSVARFVRQLRLQNTLSLVARRQVSAAAERAGYATLEAYSKAFKAEFGLSPTQFANAALNNRWSVLPKPGPVE